MSSEEKETTDTSVKTFKDLGVCDVLCQACEKQKWTAPTKIQIEAIPAGLAGNDVIGLAETGSGKTGAFALPILQALLAAPQPFFALVLTPTRELAKQIEEHFRALGACIDVKTAVLVGGQDHKQQRLKLASRPHIIIATPGRLVDHLHQTGGFSLRSLKYLVMDEADRLLAMDFEKEINEILGVLPRDRRTYLFSATMTKKVEKLKRASLTSPAKVEVDSKYKTVDRCQQHYVLAPNQDKDVYLVYLVTELEGKSMIIFCATCAATERIAQLLRNLTYHALPINGHMTQERRLGSLHKFKCETGRILVATDVASRGLDIPHVEVVINYDSPPQAKDYIHRIGRTARAGRSGQAITLVTQYDVELFMKVEMHLGQKLPVFPLDKEEVMHYQENVTQALLLTQAQLAEKNKKKKRKHHGNQEEEEFLDLNKRPKKKRKGK